MPAFVLDLRHQDRFSLQRRRAADPVAFGQHADDLRMRVLLNLADQRAPIGFRHPILRLDFYVGVDARLERRFVRRQIGGILELRDAGFDHLCVHRNLRSLSIVSDAGASARLYDTLF